MRTCKQRKYSRFGLSDYAHTHTIKHSFNFCWTLHLSFLPSWSFFFHRSMRLCPIDKKTHSNQIRSLDPFDSYPFTLLRSTFIHGSGWRWSLKRNFFSFFSSFLIDKKALVCVRKQFSKSNPALLCCCCWCCCCCCCCCCCWCWFRCLGAVIDYHIRLHDKHYWWASILVCVVVYMHEGAPAIQLSRQSASRKSTTHSILWEHPCRISG